MNNHDQKPVFFLLVKISDKSSPPPTFILLPTPRHWTQTVFNVHYVINYREWWYGIGNPQCGIQTKSYHNLWNWQYEEGKINLVICFLQQSMHNYNVLLESNLELNLGEHLKTCQDINFAFFIQSLTTLVKKKQIQLLNSSEKLPKKMSLNVYLMQTVFSNT